MANAQDEDAVVLILVDQDMRSVWVDAHRRFDLMSEASKPRIGGEQLEYTDQFGRVCFRLPLTKAMEPVAIEVLEIDFRLWGEPKSHRRALSPGR